MEPYPAPSIEDVGSQAEPGAPQIAFPVTFYQASVAIDQCWAFTYQRQPDVGPNGWGPVHVFEWGNGRWHSRGTSFYFECGCNQFRNQAPPVGDVGQLTRTDAETLEAWFDNRYSRNNGRVLKQGNKWNFTATIQNYAMNFHVQVQPLDADHT